MQPGLDAIACDLGPHSPDPIYLISSGDGLPSLDYSIREVRSMVNVMTFGPAALIAILLSPFIAVGKIPSAIAIVLGLALLCGMFYAKWFWGRRLSNTIEVSYYFDPDSKDWAAVTPVGIGDPRLRSVFFATTPEKACRKLIEHLSPICPGKYFRRLQIEMPADPDASPTPPTAA